MLCISYLRKTIQNYYKSILLDGFGNVTTNGDNLKIEFEGSQDKIYIEYE